MAANPEPSRELPWSDRAPDPFSGTPLPMTPAGSPRVGYRPSLASKLLLGVFVAFVAFAMVGGYVANANASGSALAGAVTSGVSATSATPSQVALADSAVASASTASPSPSLSSPVGTLSIDGTGCSSGINGTCPHLSPYISSNTPKICRLGVPNCPVPYDDQVTVSVNATGNTLTSPPNVQVVFVVETTLFDGVYDPLVGDPGLSSCGGPCDESNGVPFFTANAGHIATDIANKYGANLNSCNPGAQNTVCFALVDYFSTEGSDHDDGDGQEYHVDVSAFTPASQFQTAVTSTFQAVQLGGGWTYSDSDFADNILSSSSISAMYGAEQGTGLAWNAAYDHVIVWMGSTVPQDSNYVSSYAPTDSDYNSGNSLACQAPYFAKQPNCLGWAEASNSVASIAKTGNIVVDTIDLPDGMTILNSGDYLATGSAAQADVKNVLQAGCDMAVATGGSWEGPSSSTAGISFSCSAAPPGSGGQGNLTCVQGSSCEARGAEENPTRGWSSNPALGYALTNINFPSTSSNVTAKGTTGDTFNFIPSANFEIDPNNPAYHVNCSLGPSSPPLPSACSTIPNFINLGPNQGVGWAWPDNTMYLGDKWTAEFNIVAKPSFPATELNIPVVLDACSATQNPTWNACTGTSFGASSVDFSSVEYDPYNTPTTPLNPAQTFGPAYVTVISPSYPLQVVPVVSPVLGVAPLSVQFGAGVSGGHPPYTSEWNLGDGSWIDAADGSHTYTEAGTFTATITTTDRLGNSTNASVTVYVFPALVGYLNASVAGNPLSSRDTLPQGSTLCLQGGTSGGVPGVTTSWTLNGTVHPGEGDWWNYTLRATGNYTFGWGAIDGLGDEVDQRVFVEVAPAAPDPPPNIGLAANRTSLPVGGTVQFTATVSGSYPPFRLAWELDGTNLSYFGTEATIQFGVAGPSVVQAWAQEGDSPWDRSNAEVIIVTNSSSLPRGETEPPASTPGPRTPGEVDGQDVIVTLLLVFGTTFVATYWMNLARPRRRPERPPPPPPPPVVPRGFDERASAKP